MQYYCNTGFGESIAIRIAILFLLSIAIAIAVFFVSVANNAGGQQWSFRKTRTMGTLAIQTEIGVTYGALLWGLGI